MKKTLLLTLATGLATALPLMADTDIYITGSTAFRANVHDACKNLFSPAPAEITGTSLTGGDSKTGSKAAQWVMTGTPIAGLTQISGTLTIHALFTGSVQGMQTVENGTKLFFLDKAGNKISNTPTIAFSDASSLSTTYPADGINFQEENVAVQPFVICKAVTSSSALANVTGLNSEQYKYAIQAGRIPLSAWTGKTSDHSTYIYNLERTKDSGTRRVGFACVGDGFNASAAIYNLDVTNNVMYHPTTANAAASLGGTGFGVVGGAGNGNANLNWGPGYVGGGDVSTALGTNLSANVSIGILSIADAKGISGSLAANNWTQVIPFNGIWPTAAGSGIAGNAGTNDYTPITEGVYSLWGYEVVIYPISTAGLNISSANDQDVTLAQLGDQNTAGTFLGVLDNQTLTPTPVVGSLVNEIVNSQPGGATAIPIGLMTSGRTSVGGTITP